MSKISKAFPLTFAVILSVVVFFAWSASGDEIELGTETRYPYEHVMHVTAVLEFDGERIEVDDLIDCRSEYTGPASRAVQLPFEIMRSELAYETADGGVLKIDIPPNICGAYSEVWAGLDKGHQIPSSWIPIIGWFDRRNPKNANKGVRYWSETAFKNPVGRLEIIDGFKVEVPEQTNEIVEEAKQQALERDMWQGASVHTTSRNLGIKTLPWYIRIPREEWARPPKYLRAPGRPADPEGLREMLDALPPANALMFIGDAINWDEHEAVMFSINDLMTGRWGSVNAIGYHGIPQRSEPRWGMFLSERSWERAQTQEHRIPFYDDWIPLDYESGKLILRTDTPGLRYHYRGYGDWYRDTNRTVDFLGKPFVNGPYDTLKGSLVFDLESRDLWVRFE